jgi:hypothetical protein
MDFFAGDRIPPASGLARYYLKSAKPNYMNALAFKESGFYYVKQKIDQMQCISLGELTMLLINNMREISLGHCVPCPLLAIIRPGSASTQYKQTSQPRARFEGPRLTYVMHFKCQCQ